MLAPAFLRAATPSTRLQNAGQFAKDPLPRVFSNIGGSNIAPLYEQRA